MNELKHYGILGMKWGVRRFRKKDGSLTPKGKARYQPDSDEDRSKKKNIFERHKDKLISKYMEKGYSLSAAEVAAKQRMRTEIIVGAIGAVALGVIAKKVITRVGQDYCDKIIKSGKTVQNINANGSEDYKNTPFYAAINRNDKKAYGMLYPHEKRNMAMNVMGNAYDGIYKNDMKITKDIKRASVNNARKILFEKMDNDPDFKKRSFDALKNTIYGFGVDLDGLYKKDPKKFYDRFNQALATPEFQSGKIHKEFYSALEKKGYNSILDINDARYSGYKDISKSPTIFFGKDVVEKVGSRKLSDLEIDKNVVSYTTTFLAKQFGKAAVTVGAVYSARKNYNDLKIIETYLKDNPDSDLSKKEILKSVKKK